MRLRSSSLVHEVAEIAAVDAGVRLGRQRKATGAMVTIRLAIVASPTIVARADDTRQNGQSFGVPHRCKVVLGRRTFTRHVTVENEPTELLGNSPTRAARFQTWRPTMTSSLGYYDVNDTRLAGRCSNHMEKVIIRRGKWSEVEPWI